MKKPPRKAVPARSRAATAESAPEYDFRGAAKNPYAARYRSNAVVVTLDPDVAAAFPTTAAVNEALRALVRRQTDEDIA
jgi:hypothetical protein